MEKKSRWDSSDSSEDERGSKLKRAKVAAVPSRTNGQQQQQQQQQQQEQQQQQQQQLQAHIVPSSSSQPAILTSPAVPLESTQSPSDMAIDYTELHIQMGSKVEHTHNPLLHGCRSVDEYQRLDYIDQGTYGAVFKAKCRRTGELVALKQVKLDASANVSKLGFPISALREVNILLSLNHPHIVKVKEMVVGSSIDKVFMVMELGDADLKTCMEISNQPFSTAEVKQLMLQLLGAVEHLHDRWYIHRDIKTSNLLYSNKGNLSLCDFGMARKYGSPLGAYSQPVITLYYRPPELLLGERFYSTSVDMWSVGCIFAELLLRKPLFPGQGELDQINTIFKIMGAPNESIWPEFSSLPLADKFTWRTTSKSKLRELFPIASFTGGVTLSDSGFDLLMQFLTFDPKRRVSAKKAREHVWFFESPLPSSQDSMPKFDFSDKKNDKK